MSSQRKIDSARANGAKSHGPITEEGRKNSSMNALKYGLTARTVLLPGEDEAENDLLLNTYFDDLEPADLVEGNFVLDLVNIKWKQRRLCGIESFLFQEEMEMQKVDIDRIYNSYPQVVAHTYAFRKLSERKALPMVSQMETNLERSYARALRTLDKRRQLRKTKSEKRTQSQDRTVDTDYEVLAPALLSEEDLK